MNCVSLAAVATYWFTKANPAPQKVILLLRVRWLQASLHNNGYPKPRRQCSASISLRRERLFWRFLGSAFIATSCLNDIVVVDPAAVLLTRIRSIVKSPDILHWDPRAPGWSAYVAYYFSIGIEPVITLSRRNLEKVTGKKPCKDRSICRGAGAQI
jgi:hypothetical protein